MRARIWLAIRLDGMDSQRIARFSNAWNVTARDSIGFPLPTVRNVMAWDRVDFPAPTVRNEIAREQQLLKMPES